MLGRLRACYLDSCVLKTQLGDRVEGGAGVTKRFVTWTALYLGPSLEMENFGILEGGAGETERSPPDCLLESMLPLSARVMALSSSARQAPTGILLGVMGRRSTSCSPFRT